MRESEEKREPRHAGLAERILANSVFPSKLKEVFDFKVVDHAIVMVPKEENTNPEKCDEVTEVVENTSKEPEARIIHLQDHTKSKLIKNIIEKGKSF